MATQATTAEPTATGLYPRLLGAAFNRLDGFLRKFHRTTPAQASGELNVEAARSRLVRLVSRLLGLPCVDGPVHVDLKVLPLREGEKWIRTFNGQPLVTRQCQLGSLLLEAAGPVTFGFLLREDSGGLVFEHRRTWLCGLPIPVSCGPRVAATAVPVAGGWHVDVRVAAPLVGILLRYHGCMRPPEENHA
jgi:hypothetical protein